MLQEGIPLERSPDREEDTDPQLQAVDYICYGFMYILALIGGVVMTLITGLVCYIAIQPFLI
jgi:hypothetical protein